MKARKENQEEKWTINKLEHQKKQKLEENNKSVSWYRIIEEEWNEINIEDSSSKRKIVLAEEYIDHIDREESDLDSGLDEELDCIDCNRSVRMSKPNRNIINTNLLQEFLYENCVCRDCGGDLRLCEDSNQHHGLGSKLYFLCKNDCQRNEKGFFTTKKEGENSSYDINKAACIGMRSIGKGHSAAL